MHDQVLLKFLQGIESDSYGRYHKDILNFSDEELENAHNYIQWLFPLQEKSSAVPGSPFLEDEKIIRILQNDTNVQERMAGAINRMERFYLENDFWLKRNNHNHLRITRILKSISLLSSKENAQEFYDFILRRVECAQPVTEESLGFWQESIKGIKS